MSIISTDKLSAKNAKSIFKLVIFTQVNQQVATVAWLAMC